MITGKFFKAVFDEINDSVADVFRYTSLRNDSAINRADKYPIFVVLKSYSIEFIFQGKIDVENLLVNSPILTIPIGSTFLLESEEVIRNNYNRVIGIKPDLNYIFSEPLEYSYSKLKIFSLHDVNWGSIKWDKNPSFLRRLFLDFLEDFFSANVFRQSPLYEYTKSHLLNSQIVKGIWLKADFFQKESYFLNNSKDEVHKDAYFKALEKWTDFLTQEANKHLFAIKKEKSSESEKSWFGFVDVELMQTVFENELYFRNTPNTPYILKDDVDRRNINFLLRNYEVVKATSLLLNKIFNHKITVIFLNVSTFIFLLFLMMFYRYWKPIIFAFSILVWIPYVYRKFNGPSNIIVKLILLLLPFLVISYFIYLPFVISIVSTIQLVPFNIDSDWLWMIVYLTLAIFSGILIFLYSLIRFASAINLVLPRLQVAISTSWIAIFSSIDIWKNAFGISIIDAIQFAGGFIVFTSIYLLFQIHRHTLINDKIKLVWKTLNVIIPGYILSLSVGLFGLQLVTERIMVHTDFFESKVVRSNIIELNTYDNKKDSLNELINSRKEILLSKKDNTKMSSYLRAKYHKEIDLLKDKFDNKETLYSIKHELRIVDPHAFKNFQPQKLAYVYPVFYKKLVLIPGFLILMSAFALFSGIFLTLLFDGKPVTEPL